MNLSAIYHRCQDNYCYCLDEDTIVISIRTGYEIEQVTLLHTDPFKTGIMGGGHRLTGTPLKMTEKKTSGKPYLLDRQNQTQIQTACLLFSN